MTVRMNDGQGWAEGDVASYNQHMGLSITSGVDI